MKRKKNVLEHRKNGLAQAQPGPGLARAWPRPKSGLSRPSKTIKIGLNRIQVVPFGRKLCQNVAPRLRIILQAPLGPKTKLKKSKNPKMLKIPISPVQSHQLYIDTRILGSGAKAPDLEFF